MPAAAVLKDALSREAAGGPWANRCDRQGTAYTLDGELGEGGQGKVFTVAGHLRLVIKRFHDALLLSDDAESLRRKVAALREKRLDKLLPAGAWPQFSVFDNEQRWCGYAMRNVKGLPLLPQLLLNPGLLEKKYPQIRRPELVALALTFLRAAELLQANGVKIGDYNPQNFRFDPARQRLGLIDTDAYQVRHNGGLYVCPVTAPEFTPPELLNASVKRRWRSQANEIFAAAIVVFLILMPGKHPFDALGADDAAENLRQGGFPYRPTNGSAGNPTGRVPHGIWGRVWDDFPVSLQERFTAIFLTGHAHPKHRGLLADLRRAVEEYEAGFRQGRQFVMPLLGKSPAAPPPTPSRPDPASPRAVTPPVDAARIRAWDQLLCEPRSQPPPESLPERLREFGWRLLKLFTW